MDGCVAPDPRVIRSDRPDNVADDERHSANVCHENADIPETAAPNPFPALLIPLSVGKSNTLFGNENAQVGKGIHILVSRHALRRKSCFFYAGKILDVLK
jgi:hypothetical protein